MDEQAQSGSWLERVLVLAPAEDARAIADAMADARLGCRLAGDMEDLCFLLVRGAGCVVLAEEALTTEGASLLAAALAKQPSWSDLPVIVLAAEGRGQGRPLRMLLSAERPTAMSLLGRPLQVRALLGAVRAALRVRGRQFEVQDALAKYRQAQEALYRSRQDLTRAQAVGQIGNWRLDVRKNELTWSQENYRIFGIAPGTPLTYETFLAAIHPDDRQAVDDQWQAGLQGEPYDLEHRIIVDGEVRWVREKAYLELDEAGNVRGGFGITQDITDHKAAEEQLRQLSQFAEENPSPVLRVAVDGTPLYANAPARSWLASLGWQGDGPVPQAVLRITTEASRSGTIIETEIAKPPGSTLWVSVVQPPGEDYVNLYGRDVSQRKRAEEALRQARDELEQRVRERTAELEHRAEQLARLTSELTLAEQRERQRLAQLLHDHLQQLLAAAKFALEPVARRVGEKQKAPVHQVLELLNESIAASRTLTAELSPPILQEAGLAAGLEWLGRLMEQKHGLEVDLAIGPDTQPEREDVQVLLFQAARELLFNVVKHAGVTTARVELTRRDTGCLALTVADEGAGFDPDRKAPGRDGATTGGFGLFSIRERVSSLGGRMDIQATPQEGTRITIICPVRASGQAGEVRAPCPPAEPADAAQAGPRDRIRVLLADDHVVMREGLSQMLTMEGDLEVVGQARDGREAVDMARRLRPDVILMDSSMPEMDGAEATRAIRAEQPDVRIIGLSMFVEADRAAAMLEAGAAAYLTKSGSIDTLLAAIRGG